MNEQNIRRIFANYIEKFDLLNGSVHQEYFKWQIAKQFKPMMDVALSAPADDLPAELAKLQKLTVWLIDNRRIQPFNGIVQYSKREPETVRSMFRSLLTGDDQLQNRIYTFLTKSHALRDKYYNGSFRFTNDVHSVTSYLAMYDPDNHYIYKPTESREFADYFEFYDDWGSGDTVKLDVYYKMCDQLVEVINASSEVLVANNRRFTGELGIDPETLYSDPKKHILAWDLIYCCSSIRYNLFYGIPDSKKTPRERQAAREKQKAVEREYEKLSVELERLKGQHRAFEEVRDYLAEVFSVGSSVSHKMFGKGEVTALEDNDRSGILISVRFQNADTKRFVLHTVVERGLIVSDSDGYSSVIESYKDSLTLFNNTKLEGLKQSIKSTEQAMLELAKMPKRGNSYNIQ